MVVDLEKNKNITGKINRFEAVIEFDNDCKMVDIRVDEVLYCLREIAWKIKHVPEDIVYDNKAEDYIKEHGFKMVFETNRGYKEILKTIKQAVYFKNLVLEKFNEAS